MHSVVGPFGLGGMELRPKRGLFDHFLAALRGDAAALSDEARSRVISVARITLIAGLIFLHYGQFPNSHVSPRTGMDAAEHQVATYVNSFVLFFFFSVVPLLSAISGYLFFSFTTGARHHLARLIKRRFVSLYLPLVIWNSLYLGILVLVWAHAREYPLLDVLRFDLNTAGIPEYLNAIFGLTDYPAAFQFWFIRDLFVTVLCSPLLWLLLQRAPLLGAFGLGAIWLSGATLGIFFRPDVLFFFYIGGLLRISGTRLEIGARATFMLMVVYLAMVAARAFVPYFYDDAGTGLAHNVLMAATRAMRLVGLLACWGVLLHVAPTRLGRFVASFGGLAFFLYAIHFPLLAEMKILFWPLLPAETDGWMLAHYVASVLSTAVIGIGSGILLARKAPSAFALMNGGRALG